MHPVAVITISHFAMICWEKPGIQIQFNRACKHSPYLSHYPTSCTPTKKSIDKLIDRFFYHIGIKVTSWIFQAWKARRLSRRLLSSNNCFRLRLCSVKSSQIQKLVSNHPSRFGESAHIWKGNIQVLVNDSCLIDSVKVKDFQNRRCAVW